MIVILSIIGSLGIHAVATRSIGILQRTVISIILGSCHSQSIEVIESRINIIVNVEVFSSTVTLASVSSSANTILAQLSTIVHFVHHLYFLSLIIVASDTLLLDVIAARFESTDRKPHILSINSVPMSFF